MTVSEEGLWDDGVCPRVREVQQESIKDCRDHILLTVALLQETGMS